MNIPKTLGLPRMNNEAGEIRVFPPDFVQFIAEMGVNIHIEEGYGSRSGYQFEDYKLASPLVHQASKEKAYQQDVVLILRCPKPDELKLINPGATLFSMLHFPTRPLRIQRLLEGNIQGISMDSVINDNNIRLVENIKSVAWNGLETAFDVLEKHWPGLMKPDKTPIKVLILGTGMVGKHAIEAATKLGSVERNYDHIENSGPGAIAICAGRNLTDNPVSMQNLFRDVDILVDATYRRDPSKPVVPNEWIASLPENAVVVDLAVDPYTLKADPPIVRGVEGIPQGNLDQYIFSPDDPNWDKTVPSSVNSKNRRTTVTCYSWPGIHAEACMLHYSRQIKPFMKILFAKGYEGLSLDGDYFERALTRATLRYFLEEQKKSDEQEYARDE